MESDDGVIPDVNLPARCPICGNIKMEAVCLCERLEELTFKRHFYRVRMPDGTMTNTTDMVEEITTLRAENERYRNSMTEIRAILAESPTAAGNKWSAWKTIEAIRDVMYKALNGGDADGA